MYVSADMWPESSCDCRASCSQSRLHWDFSFSRLLASSLHSTTLAPDHSGPQSVASRIVRLRCTAADAVARRSLAGDTDQISALGAALDRLSTLADRLGRGSRSESWTGCAPNFLKGYVCGKRPCQNVARSAPPLR